MMVLCNAATSAAVSSTVAYLCVGVRVRVRVRVRGIPLLQSHQQWRT
jgi:hypothetical protein